MLCPPLASGRPKRRCLPSSLVPRSSVQAPPRPSARSCFAFLNGVEHPHLAEERGRGTVADRRDLARLALAAVEGAAEYVGLRPADRLHRVPEVRRRRLVGDVPELAVEPAVPDPEEPLAGELEVVPLHVDRPGL